MQSLLVVNVNLLNETPDVSWMRPVRDSDHLSLNALANAFVASWPPKLLPISQTVHFLQERQEAT
jgi:hypothetical protein